MSGVLKARPARTEGRSRAAVSSEDKRLNITLSANDYKRLKRRALDEDRSLKAVVAEAVSRYLDEAQKP